MDDSSKEIEVTISLQHYDDKVDSIITEKRQITLPLDYQVCPRCDRIARNYHEAILQIRGAQGSLSPEESNMILEETNMILETRFREHPHAFVSKIVQKNEGIDLYFGSSNCATTVAYHLRDAVAASINISKKLIGLDKSTGKRQYRIYISVRLPPLGVGDFIKMNDAFYEVHAIGGGKLTLRDLETGVHQSILVNALWSQLSQRRLEIFPKSESVAPYLIVAVTADSFHLMNMNTYENYEVKKICNNVTNGDFVQGMVVQGFERGGKVFLLKD